MISSFLKCNRLSPLVSVVALAAVSTGCASERTTNATARVNVVNRTASALSAGDITSITGTYDASCAGRSALGTDAWTVSLTGGPAVDELKVRTNDNCGLTLTHIVTGADSYEGDAPIGLFTDYAVTAPGFTLDADPLAFYGNAKISSLEFDGDFVITLLVSDIPVVSVEADKAAIFATQLSTVMAGTVPASNYTIAFSSFVVEKDIDNLVVEASGYAQLTAGNVLGQNYAVYDGDLSVASTLAQVEAAFAAPISTGLLSALTTLRIPAAGFALENLDLGTPPQRTVIIRNTDPDSNVSSYQLFVIAFVP